MAVGVHWNVWGSHPTSVTIYGPDQLQSISMLRWVPFALAHGHNPLFSAYSNYPYGVNMLVNTSVLLLGLLAAPVTVLLGPVAAYNALMTLALSTSAASAYLLLRRWVQWRPAAAIGGLLFGFSPYAIGQSLGHLHLVFTALVPLFFWALDRLVRAGGASPWRPGCVLALIVVGQFFLSPELMVTTVLIGVAALGAAAWACRPLNRDKARHTVTSLLIGAAAAAAVLAYPIWFMERGPGHVVGPVQPAPQAYRADLLGPLVPDSLMRLAPAGWARTAGHFAGNAAENGSYLGVTLLVVLAVSVVVLRRDPVIKVSAVTGVAAFVLSLGAAVVVRSAPMPVATGFPLPGRVLADLPLVSNIVPARFSLFVDLAAAAVLARALERLHASVGRSRRRGAHRTHAAPITAQPWSSLVVPSAVAIVALLPLLPVTPIRGVAPVATPGYFTSAAVDTIPDGSVAVLYPYPTGGAAQVDEWQAAAGLRFKMVGGFYVVPGPDHHLATQSPAGRASITSASLLALQAGTPPARSDALRSSILAEWRGWHVGTLIAVPDAGADPAGAVAFFQWLTGEPPTREAGALVWYRLHP